MNSRHLTLIVLTGVSLIIFAPTSRNTEPARMARIVEKQDQPPLPPVKKIKAVLPSRLALDGAGVLSNRKSRPVLIDERTGAVRVTDD